MYYVAIDPSPVHTAIVWKKNPRQEGSLGCAGVTKPILEAIDYITLSIRTLKNDDEPATFIVERPPQAPRGMTVESQQTVAAYWMLVWTIQQHWPEAPLISMGPGSWKPAAKGWKIEYPSTLTDIHQRDAYAMLQVYLAGKRGSR